MISTAWRFIIEFAFDAFRGSLTGGPDCIIRLWNPITPNQPKTILSGHNAGIMHIFFQDIVAKIYSIDRNKVTLAKFLWVFLGFS